MNTGITLTQKILHVINDDSYTIVELIKILEGISTFTSNSSFKTNLDQIIEIIITDRDGNYKFDINDIKILTTSISAMTLLVNAILLFMIAVYETKIEINSKNAEEFVFKLLAYIFLILVPQKTGTKWTHEERRAIVTAVVDISTFIKSSQIAQKLFLDIKKLFKTNTWCTCSSASIDKQQIVNTQIKPIRNELQYSMVDIRFKSDLQNSITNLEQKINNKPKKSSSKNK